jgi:hypothetical protein
MAVTQHPSGTGVLLAIATSVDTAAIGLATQDIPVGDSGSISVDAIVVVADWTLVTAEAAPTLAPRGIYFLSDSTPGILTLTPPSAPGSVVQMVARSLDPNAVDLILDQPILL